MTGAGRGQDPRRGPLTQAVCPGPAVVLGSQPLVLPTVRTRVRQGAGGLPPACTLGVPEGGGQRGQGSVLPRDFKFSVKGTRQDSGAGWP